MTFDEFKESLGKNEPPNGIPELLGALWHDANSDWDKAHKIAQDIATAEAARVHAYLHRKEGDLDNARYWYRTAGQPECHDTLEQEWEQLTREMLQNRQPR